MKKTGFIFCLYAIWLITSSFENISYTLQNAKDKSNYLILTDQSQNRIVRVDLKTRAMVWEWKAATGVPEGHVKWFSNMSEAKLVYKGKYMLITASGGGVALVRIADKKTMFYTFVGGNTHSAEILPDGNIVTASSTGGFLTLVRVDLNNFPENVVKKTIALRDAHNVVWDHKRQVLWSASVDRLNAYSYNFNCKAPDLTLKESIDLPATGCHDLFPVYGKDQLWLSTSKQIWTIDLKTKKVKQAAAIARVKSVDSGPKGYPTIILQAIDTKKQWYNDKVLDFRQLEIFGLQGLKLYKARWELPNKFSYAPNQEFKTCN